MNATQAHSEHKHCRENNDCTVRAVGAACGVTYTEAYRSLANAGRRPGHGFALRAHLGRVLAAHDCYSQPLDLTKYATGRTITVKRLATMLHTGRYLAFVRGHVLAIVDGTVCDWTEGRRHRVYRIERVWQRAPIVARRDQITEQLTLRI